MGDGTPFRNRVGAAVASLPSCAFALLFVMGGTSAGADCVESAVVFYDNFETGDPPGVWSSENLMGVVRDYWTGAAIPAASVVSASPARNDTSGAAGTYRLLDLAPAPSISAVGSKTSYRTTGNGPMPLSGVSLSCDLFLMTPADISRQYANLGETATAGRALMVAELRRPDGTPLEGIPLADIQLTNGSLDPIGLGPYFFGSGGDVVSNGGFSVSTAFGGRVRVAFLDVPVTAATLTVTSVEQGVGGSVTFTPIADGGNVFVLGGE